MKIYLAGPYSHPDPAVREERYVTLSRMAALITSLGQVVYSPISHTHSFLTCAPEIKLPSSWEFWVEADTAFLQWSDALWVYCLPGWSESKGVAAEVELAMGLGLDLTFLHRASRSGHIKSKLAGETRGCFNYKKDSMSVDDVLSYFRERDVVISTAGRDLSLRSR